MPNPLSAIFNPQPSSYDPRKEQMLASMFGQQQPIRGWGDAIASGLKSIVAARGLNAQGKAREREDTEKQQALAQALGGVSEQLGIPVESLTALADHPLGQQITGELLQRGRPQEAATPPADPLGKPYGSPLSWVNEGGRVARHHDAARRRSRRPAEGFRPAPPQTPAAQQERRIVEGCVDGFQYYAILDSKPSQRVIARRAGTRARGRSGAELHHGNERHDAGWIGAVRCRLGRICRDAIENGGTLPQGSSRQRPMTEIQIRASLGVGRMEPAMEELFAERGKRDDAL